MGGAHAPGACAMTGALAGVRRERSAGGVVIAPGGLLMVKVENLLGEVVWTFPKGHIERGETPEQAAVREVREETGWTCRILAPITTVNYRFVRNERPVQKTVHWFRMEALDRTGDPDPDEILDCRFCTMDEVDSLLVYESDRALLRWIRKPPP